jgi:hypothetical protein
MARSTAGFASLLPPNQLLLSLLACATPCFIRQGSRLLRGPSWRRRSLPTRASRGWRVLPTWPPQRGCSSCARTAWSIR